MVEQDYIMRIIHEMVRTLLKLLFHVDEEKEELLKFEDEDTARDYDELRALADSGKINEAENRLYEVVEEGNLEDLKLALAFYDYLNTKSNEYLEGHAYSRQEIADGMKQIIRMYGYESLADTLLETVDVE